MMATPSSSKLFHLLLTFLFAFQTSFLFSQATVVKDVNTNPAYLQADNNYSEFFCKCDNYLYFLSQPSRGEIWRTDGTEKGTVRVTNYFTGYGLSNMICFKNKLYFKGDDGQTGNELWVTNGTAEGTVLFKEFNPGGYGTFNGEFGIYNEQLYFMGYSQKENRKITWKSDGSSLGTVALPQFPSVPASLYTDNYFYYIDNGIYDDEQQKFIFIASRKSVNDGSEMNFLTASYISNIKKVNGKVFIVSNSDPSTSQLRLLNENDGTTTLLGEFNYIQPTLFEYNGKLLFDSYPNGVQISDGTLSGTVNLSSNRLNYGVIYDGLFYGIGWNGMFKTDGTVQGTSIINLNGNISWSQPNSVIPIINNKFIIAMNTTDTGDELSISDLSSSGTQVIKDIYPGEQSSRARLITKLGNAFYFLANDGIHGSELWTTDGTNEGTKLVKDVRFGTEDGVSFFNPFHTINDKLCFDASPQENKIDLFATDESQQVTKVLSLDYQLIYLGKNNSNLFYFNEAKLIKSNGQQVGTTVVKDYAGAFNGWEYEIRGGSRNYDYELNGKIIFRVGTYGQQALNLGYEFWITDGTENGTFAVKDIYPGSQSGVPFNEASKLQDQFLFGGNDGINGAELWTTNGTEAGTVMIKDIYTGPESSNPRWPITLNDKVVFTANEGTKGTELWVTDGTVAGTLLIKDIRIGPNSSSPEQLVKLEDYILFSAFDDEHGWALWKTNGTATGTVLVKDVMSSSDINSTLTNLKTIGNLLYFSTDDGEHGNELWVSDGTTSGTRLMDLTVGSAGSNPSTFTDANGLVYFKANNQLWKTDGFHAVKASDLTPEYIIYYKGWIYFTAFTSEYGKEVYKIQVTKEDQSIDFAAVPVKVVGANPFDLTASASSSLPVNFSTSMNNVTITNNKVTLVKPGTVTIKANQPGNAYFNPAVEVSRSFCINPAQPAITQAPDASGGITLTSSSESGNQWFINGSPISNATSKTLLVNQTGIYTLKVTVDNCQSEISADQNISITAVENKESKITLSPNPASSSILIQSVNGNDDVTIEILNLNGQKLTDYKLRNNSFINHNVQDYPRGIYLLKLITTEGIYFTRFVKE